MGTDRSEAGGDIGCCGYILWFLSIVLILLTLPFSLCLSIKVSLKRQIRAQESEIISIGLWGIIKIVGQLVFPLTGDLPIAQQSCPVTQ